MKQTILVLAVLLSLGVLVGYASLATPNIIENNSTLSPELAKTQPSAEATKTKSESTNPATSNESPAPKGGANLPILTAAQLQAQYQSYVGQTVTVSGLIKREVQADASEPASNYLSVFYLGDLADTRIKLQTNDGEFIECTGIVDSCGGVTVDESVTVTVSVIELPIGFAARLP